MMFAEDKRMMKIKPTTVKKVDYSIKILFFFLFSIFIGFWLISSFNNNVGNALQMVLFRLFISDKLNIFFILYKKCLGSIPEKASVVTEAVVVVSRFGNIFNGLSSILQNRPMVK